MSGQPKEKGPIAWMAAHAVAANLVMFILLVGGWFLASKVKQEVFPEFELDIVLISVPYPGASPEEVEKGIILASEEAVRGLEGVKKVTSTASEGSGSVVVELMTGTNPNKALQDVKNAIDRITSFPQDAERPQVSLVTNRREVISLVLYGDLDEHSLRSLGEMVREELLGMPDITTVNLTGVKPLEISIEVPHENLRAHNITLDQIAGQIRRGAVELPAGAVKTESGEILLRTAERRDYGREFKDIPIISHTDGTEITLGEIGQVRDGFRDTDQSATFNGLPAVQIGVFRLGNQKPIEISELVHKYEEELSGRLPEGVGVSTWFDSSEMYADRIGLLVKNAGLGLLLVMFIMGLFLEIRLAFWVTLGIPISVLGSFLLFPTFDVSINMISLFAFIITLGIVVDDAVVVGENVYEYRQRGFSALEAAIKGTRQVAVPVTFSILTNIAAFGPMLFVPGVSGKFFRVIPIIAISVFAVSWLESLFVLPSHLAHQKRTDAKKANIFKRVQLRFSAMLMSFIENYYKPAVEFAVRFRYFVVACGTALLIGAFGLIAGGRLQFTFLPKIQSDQIIARLTMPFGTPAEETQALAAQMVERAQQVLAENGGDDISRGILTTIGSGFSDNGPAPSGSHLATVFVYLVPSGERDITSGEFATRWRELFGNIPGVESLTFEYSTGAGAGAPIDFELSHADLGVLEKAAADLAVHLSDYAGVKDINDGFSQGKPQFDFTIKPEAQVLGLTAMDLGNQLRNAFYGARAFRQQRGREEVWVMVRLPEEERSSEYHLGQIMVRTPRGGEIPLSEAADIDRGRAYTTINRRDGKRVVNVTADVVAGVANPNEVVAEVRAGYLNELLQKYPGLGSSLEGEQAEQRETLSALGIGFALAMMVIYALLAIPFGSYLQPAIVMTAIPFGIVGAVVGHIIMGYDLSLISMMGIVALSGVVVNDSLVLIHTANEMRLEGDNAHDAIIHAGARRFRPILLTSLTTFFGLAPMIFETSVQARFLIPMAVSIGFGILFATALILGMVPALYMILEDLLKLFGIESKLEPVGEHETFSEGDQAYA